MSEQESQPMSDSSIEPGLRADVDALLAAALDRGGRTLETGRSIVTFRSLEEGTRALTAQGITTPRPIQARKPVGYSRAFLAGYQSNRSSYLSAADKAQLAAISKTVDAADPRAGTYAQRILNRLLIDLSWNSSRLEGNT